MAAAERGWIDLIPGARAEPVTGGDEAGYEPGFPLPPDRSLAEALAELDAVAAWTVRWVLLHLVEEIGRHAGHRLAAARDATRAAANVIGENRSWCCGRWCGPTGPGPARPPSAARHI